MGAQQTKSYDERLTQHIDNQRHLPMKRFSNEVVSQLKTPAMHNQKISSVSGAKQYLTVADFAKIKIESLSIFDNPDAATLREQIKIEDQGIPDRAEVIIYAENNFATVFQERYDEIDFISLASIKPKEELLSSHAAEKGEPVIQNDASLSLNCDANAGSSGQVQFPIQSEIEGNHFITNIAFERKEDKSNILLIETENGDDDSVVTNFKLKNSTKLVKNPLAFLKKYCEKNREQEKSLNEAIKSEPGEELVTTNCINADSESQTISLKELIIKSEDFFLTESNDEETLKNSNLYQSCLSYNLDSSLDVNLSHEGTDLDEFTSTQLSEDVISNTSINTTTQSIKYFSTFEISSEEHNIIPPEKSHLNQIIKTRRAQKAVKKKNNRQYKIGKTQSLQNKQVKNCQQNKRLGRPKTNKLPKKNYSKDDSAFKVGLKERDVMKKLPKRAMKTRKNTKKTVFVSEAEFPKPFKLETRISQKCQNTIVELPKPILYKNEFSSNSKNRQSYLKPEFQPLVRLKRLKDEELLVPLRTKYTRRTRKLKGTSEIKRNFLIQSAYSLNPSNEFSLSSMDHNKSFHNKQPLISSLYAPSNKSVLTDMQIESVGEMESKYFNPQERVSICKSSTPDVSARFSGPLDSGVSTSTPLTSQHIPYHCNKSLLLEIAAERAFINNHLMHFGYSPVHFDLYNNLNELAVFLKFLFGNMKAN